MPRSAPLLLLVLAGACSSDTTVAASCSQSFTGAITATATCADPVVILQLSNNKSAFALHGTGSPPTTATIIFTGEPTVRSYTITDRNGDLGGINISSGQYFAGLYFPPSLSGMVQTVGSYTLTLTSVDNYSTTVAEKDYHVHGSIDATVAGTNGTPGTVTYHATF